MDKWMMYGRIGRRMVEQVHMGTDGRILLSEQQHLFRGEGVGSDWPGREVARLTPPLPLIGGEVRSLTPPSPPIGCRSKRLFLTRAIWQGGEEYALSALPVLPRQKGVHQPLKIQYCEIITLL